MDLGFSDFREAREAHLKRLARYRSLADLLDRHGAASGFGLGEPCAQAAQALRKAVADAAPPDDYRVAVIGRFNVGKSSFVNELLGQRLAGVNTSPETAAITTFREGPTVRATVALVAPETWTRLKAIHEADPADPEARRIAQWLSFARRSPADGEPPFDLPALEAEHLGRPDHRVAIAPSPAGDESVQRKAMSQFGRDIKRWTTSSQPLHCLVEQIEIVAPAPILKGGVTLIDTPGLDDTERYRVQLTERAVEQVDAVLFLTKFDSSYGQSDKDFLLSLMRKGAVRQVMIVVTQVDDTLQKAEADAEAEGEDPPDAATLIARERTRLRSELQKTLDEAARDAGEEAVARYREQLDALEIAFISASNHRKAAEGKPVAHPLDCNDPGGMAEVSRALIRLLSSESRLAQAERALRDAGVAALSRLAAVIDARRRAVAEVQDGEAAAARLADFRRSLGALREDFAKLTADDFATLTTVLAGRAEARAGVAETVALQAGDVLREFEADDRGRHWRTRRNGGWGGMRELQTRVANRVFPRVQQQLDRDIEAFSGFLDSFRGRLTTFSDDLRRLTAGAGVALDPVRALSAFLDEAGQGLQGLIEDENRRILALLDAFVDDAVEERIAAAREKVSAIWGRGTTAAQTEEVRAFYAAVRKILLEAVQAHVSGRLETFASLLRANAGELPGRSLAQLDAELDRAAADLRAAAEASAAEARARFTAEADAIAAALADAPDRLPLAPQAVNHSPSPSTPTAADAQRVDSVDAALQGAQQFLRRHTLENNARGWSFARILGDAPYGALRAWLVDPHLGKHHQQRNLLEFIVAVTAVAKLKSLHIVTKPDRDVDQAATAAFFERLAREAWEHHGLSVDVTEDETIHDRHIAFDTGRLIRLGRGLDIFKPAPGIAARDQKLRSVRACTIEHFGPA